METFADCPALGRLALRDAGHTLAIGHVISLKPLPLPAPHT